MRLVRFIWLIYKRVVLNIVNAVNPEKTTVRFSKKKCTVGQNNSLEQRYVN